MAKEELCRKICFPYTAVVKVPSLVKHAKYDNKQIIKQLKPEVPTNTMSLSDEDSVCRSLGFGCKSLANTQICANNQERM